MAEALAARRAMDFTRELSLFDVIPEGDSLRVIQALNCPGCCNTLFGDIVNETLGGYLRQCKFQHICWEGNRLAHGLARKTISFADIDI